MAKSSTSTSPARPAVAAHDNMVLQQAIVGYMDIGHDQAIIAHNGLVPGFGSFVDGYIFPDDGIVTNLGRWYIPLRYFRSWGSPEITAPGKTLTFFTNAGHRS